MIAFPRAALAQELVAALQGKALLGDAHNGLFLAAPAAPASPPFCKVTYDPRWKQPMWSWCMWICGPIRDVTRVD